MDLRTFSQSGEPSIDLCGRAIFRCWNSWEGRRSGGLHDWNPLTQTFGSGGRYDSDGVGPAFVDVPVAPQMLEAIVAMPPNGTLFFLVTHKGLPFTAAGFGNFFKDACIAAGLPHCSAHGLRKAIVRCMADLNWATRP